MLIFHLRALVPAALLLSILSAPAQDPNLASNDLAFTQRFAAKNHLIAQVALEVKRDQWLHYCYDRYSDVQRITDEDGVFARLHGKAWLRSADWGKTGLSLSAEAAERLDTLASVVENCLEPSVHHDLRQGKTVWKPRARERGDGSESFTFEESREHPRPDGFYPLYTFTKFAGQHDGQLILSRLQVQFHIAGQTIPADILFDILIPMPAKITISKVPPPGDKPALRSRAAK